MTLSLNSSAVTQAAKTRADTFEECRYGALGRRVWVRSRTQCVPVDAIGCITQHGYLTLIDAITLLHQHQRPIRTVARQGTVLRYVEATAADVAAANRLAAEVLTRSLDERPPQTRRFLTVLDAWIVTESAKRRVPREAFRFLAREARAVTGLGATQVKLHRHRLVDLEYVLVHRASRGQGVLYELVVDGADHATEGGPAPRTAGYDPERSKRPARAVIKAIRDFFALAK